MKRGVVYNAAVHTTGVRRLARTKAMYNGWTNRETWCVSLWIYSTENWEAYWAQAAKDLVGNDDAVDKLSSRLEEDFNEGAENLLGKGSFGFWSDMLGHALELVNWTEIAKGMMANAST